MAEDVEAKVVTAPAAAATASAASATDYIALLVNAPLMAVGTLATREAHVSRARALWLVLAGLRPQARLHAVLIDDLATFASSGRSSDPGFKQLGDDLPGFWAWTNSDREVLVAPRLFSLAGAAGVTTPFVDAIALVSLAHEVEHVLQFRETGGPPTSYRAMGSFEVPAYTRTRGQIANVRASTVEEATLLTDLDQALARTIAACRRARDAKNEADALAVFTGHDQLLPARAGHPPATLYVPTP